MTRSEQIFELINSFKKVQETDKVTNYKNPHQLSELVNLSLGNKHGKQAIETLVEDYISYSVKTGHKQYLNQLFSGFNQAGLVGELLAALMNTSMYTYEVAPLATLIEREVIAKMNSYTGFSNGDGIFTSGGSNSNMVAMLCARHQMFPDFKQKGMSGMKPISLFVSKLSHYSFQKGSYTLGIGSDYLYGIETNSRGEMVPEKLNEAIELSKSKGEQPFFVAATAGTTELGAFDNIEKNGEIARKHNLWFHVDGSWGGSIILSNTYKNLFKGLNKADSFAWNAHKLMNAPLVASALLLKDNSILYNATSASKTDYIFHEHDFKQYDLGTKSLQCGRKNDALKVWFAWKAIGDEQYAKNIDKLMSLAQYAQSIIEKDNRLELLAPTQTLNINFRYNTPHIDDLNQFNRDIRNGLIEQGDVMVNYCHLGDIISIRLVLVNQEIEKEDLDHFFTTFAKAGDELVARQKDKTLNAG
ncbi:MAG: pyridoxal phosphate-dependent decarboxylase family protein [Bacteroidia bacterium]